MYTFKCVECEKDFTTKGNLERHRKITGHHKELTKESKGELVLLEDVGFECNFCKKKFTSQFNLERHMYNSPNTPCYLIRHLKATTAPIIIPTTNNIKNIIQPNFVKHGFEYIDHITKEVMLELLKLPSFVLFSCELMKKLYFSIEVPQNNNWTIAYPKNLKAGVVFNYNSQNFERGSTIDIIDDKFSNMMNLFQPLIEEIYREDQEKRNLTPIQRRNACCFYEHYGMMQISIEDTYLFEQLRDVAYNNKSVPMTNWKEQGLSGNHLSLKF
jgi:hypothetical protein